MTVRKTVQDQVQWTRVSMAKQVQNAMTICGNRIGWDTENDDIMIVVRKDTWSPVPDNDQETVCWFEPFVDEVSGGLIHHVGDCTCPSRVL